MAKRIVPVEATAVKDSQNTKIGRVAATYATQLSCPDSCSLKPRDLDGYLSADKPKLDKRGCYANGGMAGWATADLNRHAVRTYNGQAKHVAAAAIARVEADAIDALPGTLPMRLHVVGDCSTDTAAGIVSEACDRYTAKHDQPVWTYTHAWADVERSSWGETISVLASCETPAEVAEAQSRGYATALVVDRHSSSKVYELDGVKVLPCLQQTGARPNCRDCGFCLLPDDKKRGLTVGFEIHGEDKRAAAKSIAAKLSV